GLEHRPGTGNPRRMRTAYLHHRTDRSRFRTPLRANPAPASAGSTGDAGRSDIAWTCGRFAMGQDKPSGGPIFRSTRHPALACPVRSLPGIHGPDVSCAYPNGIPGFDAGRSETRVGWGKITNYTAQAAATPVFETLARGRTSNIKRRVERNPV